MNKQLNDFFQQLGFKIDGNQAYGEFKGYEVSANVVMLDTVSPVKLHVNMYASNIAKEQMIAEIKELKYKFFVVDADIYGVFLGFNDPLTVGRLLKRLPDMLEQIFKVFDRYGAKGIGYCPVCGGSLQEDCQKYKLEWVSITMDKDCVGNINGVIEQSNKDFDELPNNYLKGTLGALLGAAIGIVAYFILFSFGFISALTSIVALLLGSYFYKKFGGKPNKVMVVIVSIISVAAMLLAAWLIYIAVAQTIAIEYGFLSTGIQAFKDMMSVSEFANEFTTNILMTLVYTVFGAVYEIVRLSKSIKRQGSIK